MHNCGLCAAVWAEKPVLMAGSWGVKTPELTAEQQEELELPPEPWQQQRRGGSTVGRDPVIQRKAN